MLSDSHGWQGLQAGGHIRVPRLSPALSNGDRYRRIIGCLGDDSVVLEEDSGPRLKAVTGDRDSASAERLQIGGLIAVLIQDGAD